MHRFYYKKENMKTNIDLKVENLIYRINKQIEITEGFSREFIKDDFGNLSFEIEEPDLTVHELQLLLLRVTQYYTSIYIEFPNRPKYQIKVDYDVKNNIILFVVRWGKALEINWDD